MIASDRIAGYERKYDSDDVMLARVPQRAFGDTTWVRLALKGCLEHLAPAIKSGKSQRVANAVRAITHAPSPEQVDDVIGAACDSLLTEAYARRDSRLITNVAMARPVIDAVISELRDRSQREAIAPGMLRETVDTYLQLIALVDKRLADRLDAVGEFAARVAAAMHLAPAEQLEIELAGRLHDVGTLALPGLGQNAESLERSPRVGAAFLNSVPSLAQLAPIVRSYHERFDGRGFPDGISGAEIPLASRVISVAVAFVELVNGSAAREAMLPNAACHELAVRSGSEFDPDVVTATLHLLRYRQRTHRSA
jgi:response regulator RpfG family c-di-GMP phosphodiesterase